MNVIIGIVGNPNCGKTTLFNILTGTHQKVGNWPGVTVEKKTGVFYTDQGIIDIVDLPGIYSLSASSPDEKVSQDYIFSESAHLIVNIIDASNIERNLYLTSQLLEMKVPLVIAVNMMDIAKSRKIHIDIEKLEKELGCPVIPIVGSKGEGIDELKEAIFEIAQTHALPQSEIIFSEEIENAIENITQNFEKQAKDKHPNPRWITIKLLEDEMEIPQYLDEEFKKILITEKEKVENVYEEDIDVIFADQRFGGIHQIVDECISKESSLTRTWTDKIDTVVLNRIWGIPIFLFSMYLTFMITINFGGAFIDFFDKFVGAIAVDGFRLLLNQVNTPEWLIAILADGVGGGIQTVATFIPPIGMMFLCLSVLESSGYMARAAFVIDRFMRSIGLPGKSIVPMMIGFGCNVPAIMAARTLENKRDRLLTIIMAPLMSCGARLSVYALFAAAFFPQQGQNIVFLLYFVGIVIAMLTGFLLKSTILKGDISPFILELPPYHIPSIRSTFIYTWERLRGFLLKAGKIIIFIVIILNTISNIKINGTHSENINDSILSQIGKSITPVFHPMGLRDDNWPAVVGIFTGIFAKEAVVGTLDSLYTLDTEKKENNSFNIKKQIYEALLSIPENFEGLSQMITDPFGMGLGDVSDKSKAAEEQNVSKTIFGNMANRFDGKIGAFAYLLFILLYIPCAATIATIHRETNRLWATFSVAYLSLLGWTIATLFYQTATFSRHPLSSASWIIAIISLFLIIIGILIYLGKPNKPSGLKNFLKKEAAFF